MELDQILEAMMANKPTRRYVSDSIPFSGGYHAVWGIPGLVPDFVYDLGPDGQITNRKTVFRSNEEAIDAARKIGWDALHKRAILKVSSEGQKKYATKKMSGEEMALALGRLQLSPFDFAMIMCTSPERVFSWIDNEVDAPGVVWVVLGLMEKYESAGAVEDAIDIISSKTEIKPQHAKYQAKAARLTSLINSIRANLPQRADDVTLRFEAVVSPESQLTMTEKIQNLEEIAADLGLGSTRAPADSLTR